MLNAEAELAKLRTERDAAKIASNLSHEAVRLATKQNDRLLILCGKLREALIVANSWTYNATPREVLEPIRQTIQEANEVLGEVRG